MPTILGIDAAWTASEPSGVALVKAQGTVWRCLAVAPSYEAFVGLASGWQVDWTQPSFAGSIPNIPEILEASAVIAGNVVDVVALDMPVAKIPILSRRCADNQISIEFGSRWCSAHTPTPSVPVRWGWRCRPRSRTRGIRSGHGGNNERHAVCWKSIHTRHLSLYWVDRNECLIRFPKHARTGQIFRFPSALRSCSRSTLTFTQPWTDTSATSGWFFQYPTASHASAT
jgi:hypothetical protein